MVIESNCEFKITLISRFYHALEIKIGRDGKFSRIRMKKTEMLELAQALVTAAKEQ